MIYCCFLRLSVFRGIRVLKTQYVHLKCLSDNQKVAETSFQTVKSGGWGSKSTTPIEAPAPRGDWRFPYFYDDWDYQGKDIHTHTHCPPYGDRFPGPTIQCVPLRGIDDGLILMWSQTKFKFKRKRHTFNWMMLMQCTMNAIMYKDAGGGENLRTLAWSSGTILHRLAYSWVSWSPL